MTINNAVLKNCLKLSSKITVYVPATNGIDQAADNSLIISALYDTVEAAIKHLGGSRRETILPDGRVVIPESVNYPELAINNIFVPFSAVRAEVWPGEPGWGK